MLTKEQSRAEVERLVKKYEALGPDAIKLTEEETKKDLILPMFKALNWDTENSREVSAEENISKKRVDYGFRIGGIPKFFLEAKAIKETLNEEHAKQSINYSWLKSTTWAVLTNFTQLQIYNAEWKSRGTWEKRFFFLRFDEYVPSFDKLWLLSRDAFATDALDVTAEEWGKKQKRVPVSPVVEQLFADLIDWRQRLTKDITSKKSNLAVIKTDQDLDECVQRILDRLIFIRVCEDRQIEPFTLLSRLREWKGGRTKSFYKLLVDVFREFDTSYNSRLFAPHLADYLEVDDLALSVMIGQLYENRELGLGYDFSAIDADVLGSIYEQYLGYILEKHRKKATVVESYAQRKKMGIYYTPTYITNFIVRATIGEFLERSSDTNHIRILDPACGSGSFLIAALDALVDRQKVSTFDDKIAILKSSIFAVDLDPKAVEIAQFNLLMRVLEKRRLLPKMDSNIKVGNSLVEDPRVDPHAIVWDGVFPDIIESGGFDAVIGNPPYIRAQTASQSSKEYLERTYHSAKGKYDIYVLFMEKALGLLKKDGVLGFIVPNKFTQTIYGEQIKELILGKFWLKAFVDFGDLKVFGDATTYPSVVLIQNSVPLSDSTFIKVKRLDPTLTTSLLGHLQDTAYEDDLIQVFKFKQAGLDTGNWHFLPKTDTRLYEKLQKHPKLSYFTEKMIQGFITGSNPILILEKHELGDIERSILKKVPKAKDIRKYWVPFEDRYVIYGNDSEGKPMDEPTLSKRYPNAFAYLKKHEAELRRRRYFGKTITQQTGGIWTSLVHPVPTRLFDSVKIVVPNLSRTNRFALDTEGYYIEHDCYVIVLKESYSTDDYHYFLGILNSKVAQFVITQISPMFSGGYYKYHTQYLKEIPIPDPAEVPASERERIIRLVKQAISLNAELEHTSRMSDEASQLAESITKTEKAINEAVYDLYGLTDSEKQKIEEAVKED